MARDEFIIFRVSSGLRNAYKEYAKKNKYRYESDLGRDAISQMVGYENKEENE